MHSLSIMVLYHLVSFSTGFSFSTPQQSSIETLLQRAKSQTSQRKTDAAFQTLSEIYAIDPNTIGLNALFEECLKVKVEDGGNARDLMGLASLLVDGERYEEASFYLHQILSTGQNHPPDIRAWPGSAATRRTGRRGTTHRQ